MASPFAHDNIEKPGDYHGRNDYEPLEQVPWKFTGFGKGRESLVFYPNDQSLLLVEASQRENCTTSTYSIVTSSRRPEA
jgi:hypothetical protein